MGIIARGGSAGRGLANDQGLYPGLLGERPTTSILDVLTYYNGVQLPPPAAVLVITTSSGAVGTAPVSSIIEISTVSAGIVTTTLATLPSTVKITTHSSALPFVATTSNIEVVTTLAGARNTALTTSAIEVVTTQSAILRLSAYSASIVKAVTTQFGILQLQVNTTSLVKVVTKSFGETNGSTATLIVVNADTAAISIYELPVSITGITTLDGVLYATTENGLYALDGDTDAGADIEWRIDTGVKNFGSPLLKRIGDINFHARLESNARIVADVETARGSARRSDRFELPAVTRSLYRDGIIKIGKGLASVYWGFDFSGTGRIEIDEILLRVEPLSRRRS